MNTTLLFSALASLMLMVSMATAQFHESETGMQGTDDDTLFDDDDDNESDMDGMNDNMNDGTNGGNGGSDGDGTGLGPGDIMVTTDGDENTMIVQGDTAVELEGDLEVSQINTNEFVVQNEQEEQVTVSYYPQDAKEAAEVVTGLECMNCTIELKEEVEQGQQTLIYEVQVQQPARVFGFLPATMGIEVEIDAQTGAILDVDRPWWAFLATTPGTSGSQGTAGSDIDIDFDTNTNNDDIGNGNVDDGTGSLGGAGTNDDDDGTPDQGSGDANSQQGQQTGQQSGGQQSSGSGY